MYSINLENPNKFTQTRIFLKYFILNHSLQVTVVTSVTIFYIALSLLFCVNTVNGKSAMKHAKLPKIRCMDDVHGQKNCTCPEDPITERYVDHESDKCEYYYLCHLGVAIKMPCDPHDAFHPTLRECLPRERIQKHICKPVVDCPVRPNRYIEDPQDCTKFYLCYYGKGFKWTCPEGSYFEPEQERCIGDRSQAAACMKVANIHHFQTLGYNEKPPPKTTLALTEAKAFLKANKRKNQ